MSTWTGKWEFRNVMRGEHGSRGTKTVHASSESAAKSKIREEASRDLFGTTMLQRYVVVSGLREGGR